MVNSKDLLEIIKENIGKEEITQHELEKVKKLTLRRYKLNGKETDIDLSELALFKNLKTLMLSKFLINKNYLEYINTNKNMWAIQFSGCKFENVIPINQNIKYLILDYCKDINLTIINNNETIRIIGAEIDLQQIKSFEKIQRLYLQNCEINNIEELEKYPNLEYLNIDGSNINNTELIVKLSQKIQISYRKMYNPMEGE